MANANETNGQAARLPVEMAVAHLIHEARFAVFRMMMIEIEIFAERPQI